MGEVDKAMFEDFDRPSELIFYLLGMQINDLNEVAEVYDSSRGMAL
jgi:hypothetical protein